MGRNKLPDTVKIFQHNYHLRLDEKPIIDKAMNIVKIRRNHFMLGDRQEAINQLVDEFSEMVRV